MNIKNFLIKSLATGFYSGCSPIVPGTTGTVPAWLIAWFLIGDHPAILGLAAIAMTLFSVIIASAAEHTLGHDAKKIVVDEWAGMFIALLFVPYGLTNYIIAFVTFRGFDAVKIFPADAAEKLPKGWGVTADDVVAGIQANILTQIVIYILSVL